MKLKFIINKPILIRAAFDSLFRQALEKESWGKFKNEPAYFLLNPEHARWALDKIFADAGLNGFEKTFLKLSRDLKKIIGKMEKTEAVKKLIKETMVYKNFVEKQWRKNENFVFNFIKTDLGLKVPAYTINVFILHPKLSKGRADSGTKSILWGHSENWKNYATVYLAHEILHILVNKKSKDLSIAHGLIELATDNELRIRLNKGEKYFDFGKLPTTAPLWAQKKERIKKEILPYWKNYLKIKGGKTILQLESEIIRLQKK